MNILNKMVHISDVHVKELTLSSYLGEGEYFGGYEGASLFSWYRESDDGTIVLVSGANSRTYEVSDGDYNCRLIFGYTPVRLDSDVGELRLSEPSGVIFPELPRIEMLALWFCSSETENGESFQAMPSKRSCSYKVRYEDIGRCLRCECIFTDVFGRSSEPACADTDSVLPGIPIIGKLEIEGRGFHTNLYAIRGIYSGGKEGKSRIQCGLDQWLEVPTLSLFLGRQWI